MAYVRTADLTPEAQAARRARKNADSRRYAAGRREWRQAYDQARYEKRAAAGLCRSCAARLRPSVCAGVLCPVCWEKGRNRREARRALSPLTTATGGLRRGGGGRIAAVARITVSCDRQVADAIQELRRVASLAPKDGTARVTLSRLVRETIRADWGDPSVWCPPRAGCYINAPGLRFSVSVDAETLAIIDRNAARTFGGVRSRTVRAMLAASARRDRDSPFRLVTGGSARGREVKVRALLP